MLPPLLMLLLFLFFSETEIESAAVSSSSSSLSRGFRYDIVPGQSFVPFLRSSNASFAAGVLFSSSQFLIAVVGLSSSGEVLDTIWVANRDKPIEATGCSIIFDGELRIVKQQQLLLTITATSSAADDVELTETGNLVLKSNNDSVLWQSFEQPTDVLMQGQNFTRNMKLVSTASPLNFSSGPYSLQLGKDRMILLAKLGSSGSPEPYWENGALQEPGQLDPAGGPMYIRIEDGFLAMYQKERERVNVVPFASFNGAIGNRLRRAKVEPDGNFRVYYWKPDGEKVVDYEALSVQKPCRFPAACGAYGVCSEDSESRLSCRCPSGEVLGEKKSSSASFRAKDAGDLSKGCFPSQAPSLCGSAPALSGFSDVFLEVPGIDYFANEFVNGIPGSSVDSCRRACLSTCSCRAFFFRNDSRTCFHSEQLQTMLHSSNPQDIGYLRVGNPLQSSVGRISSSSSPSSKEKHQRAGLLVLAAILAASLASVGLFFYLKWRGHRRGDPESWNSDEEALFRRSNSMRSVYYSDLEIATDGFKQKQQQQQSDKGKVCFFQGPLRGHADVLVIRLSGVKLNERQLHSLDMLSRQHPNLAAPCGYCYHDETDCSFLVYEKQADSEQDSKEQESKSKRAGLQQLDISTKVAVAVGVARGLAYLESKGLEVRGGVGVECVVVVVLLGSNQQQQLHPKICGLFEDDSSHASAAAAKPVPQFGRFLLDLFPEASSSQASKLVDIAQCCLGAAAPPSMAALVALLEESQQPSPSGMAPFSIC